MGRDKFEQHHDDRDHRFTICGYRRTPVSKRYPEGVPPRVVMVSSRSKRTLMGIKYSPELTARVALGQAWTDTSHNSMADKYERAETQGAFEALVRRRANELTHWKHQMYDQLVDRCLEFVLS